MAYTNIDDRRKYQRERYQKQKQLSNLGGENDFNAAATKVGVVENSVVTKALGSEQQDDFFKKIDRVENLISKYSPIVMKFVEGFATAVKAKQLENARNVTKSNTPQPPIGWLGMTPMQKYGKKYSKPDWYAAGVAYDDAIAGGAIQAAPVVQQQPQTREDYTNDYTERQKPNYPDANEYFPVVSADNSSSKEQQQDIGSDADDKQEVAEQTEVKTSDASEISKDLRKQEIDAADEIKMALQQDNERILKDAVKQLNDMSLGDFRDKVNDVDALMQKYLPMKMFIPLQIKGMIVGTDPEVMFDYLKHGDKEKYDWLVESKNLPILKKKLEFLREELK